MDETRTLTPAVIAAAQALLEKAQRLTTEAQALEDHARTLIAKDAQIDLATEAWTLDLAGGVLTRKEPAEVAMPRSDENGQPDNTP